MNELSGEDVVAEEGERERVTLSTIHQAKGLEWRAVFMVWLAEGRFPSARAEDIEEERRLFYVACTRAKDELLLCYPMVARDRYRVHPVPAVLMLVTVAIFYFLSTRTVFGRSVYSVGGNEEASRLSGIPVGRTRITIFAISGMMAALGGVIISSRIMAGAYNVGEGLEFEVIAAVVIGGTSLAGGSGSMIGTFLGVLFMGLLSNGMTLMGVDPYWQEVARGLILLFAVLISVWQKPDQEITACDTVLLWGGPIGPPLFYGKIACISSQGRAR